MEGRAGNGGSGRKRGVGRALVASGALAVPSAFSSARPAPLLSASRSAVSVLGGSAEDDGALVVEEDPSFAVPLHRVRERLAL